MTKQASKTTERKAPPDFRKYSPSEFNALWNLSKRKILKDIHTRNGVQRRKTKAESFRSKNRDVKIVPRVSSRGGNWFYLKITGHTPFSTREIMDIKVPSKERIKSDPDGWWKKSTKADFLELEIESARRYLSFVPIIKGLSMLNEQFFLRPVFYFIAALEDWGFDREMITAFEHEEIGAERLRIVCDRFFKPSEELRRRKSQKFAAELAPPALSEEENQKRLDTYKEWAERNRKCVKWQPGQPMDWRSHPDRYVGHDMDALNARFRARYPDFVKRVEPDLQPVSLDEGSEEIS
jgi:hypothetical protein